MRSLDVRDMLCAQALALVAKALNRQAAGTSLAVRYNADDVRRDLLTWSAQRHLAVAEPEPGTLHLTKPPTR